MAKNHYISGEFNLTCDRCSKKIKAHHAKHEWTGFIVCGDCYEPRHEQDFVRARQDKITVPFQRPIPTLEFATLSCTAFSKQSVADYATADCAQVGIDYGLRAYQNVWEGK